MRKKSLFLVLSLVAVLLFCGCDVINDFFNNDLWEEENQGTIVCHFIDVGQGDCTFIELPDGKTMLIDAGTSEYGKKIVEYLQQLNCSRIDYLIATHPHSDHIGGMKAVVQSFDLDQVYMPKVSTDTKTYTELLKAIKKKGRKITAAKSGMLLCQTEDNSLSIEVLSPILTEYEDLNNYSVVIRIQYKNIRYLFMGDAEQEAEEGICDKYPDLQADVVKVGHHGSSSSSANRFVKSTKAQCAVFSVGKDNDYGHPNAAVQRRWTRSGAVNYRTDRQGTIVVSSNGKSITIETEK